jgi:nucleotide-binding universal stress UspA family protein
MTANAPRRILCATDFSAPAERAVALAVAWSRRAAADLEVLHVVEPHDGDAAPVQDVREAGSALDRLLEEHGAAREARRVVARGAAAAPVIVDHARVGAADLVVLGTHGRTGFRSLLVGSVAEEVVRTAPCPVLVVPPRPDRPAFGPPRRILVPLDFGPRAPTALRYAKELAASSRGGLVLLHVIEETVVPDFYYSLGRSFFQREPEARARAGAALERLYWEAGGPDVPFEVRVTDGRAGIDIPRIAAEIDADLVLMPTHGFSAADRLALGSTTDKVLRSTPCPVLVHRPLAAEAETGPSRSRGRRATLAG